MPGSGERATVCRKVDAEEAAELRKLKQKQEQEIVQGEKAACATAHRKEKPDLKGTLQGQGSGC